MMWQKTCHLSCQWRWWYIPETCFLDEKPPRPSKFSSLYLLGGGCDSRLCKTVCIYTWDDLLQRSELTLPSHFSCEEAAAADISQVIIFICPWHTAFTYWSRFRNLIIYLLVFQTPLVSMPESGNCTSIINLRYQDGSEGSPSNPARFRNQDYAQLKDKYLRRRKLFVDNTFPPNNQSLGDLPDLSKWREDQVEWLRPEVKYFVLYPTCKFNNKMSICKTDFTQCAYFALISLLCCVSPGNLEGTKQQRWAVFLYQRSFPVWLWARQCW